MEHVVCFLDFLAVHAHQGDPCLKDFLKSLTDRETPGLLTWNQVRYTTRSTSCHCSTLILPWWSQVLPLWAQLNTIVSRGGPEHVYKKIPRKSLGLLWSCGWRCIVNVYLHIMMEEYRIFFVNFSSPSISRLLEAVYHTNESMDRTSRSSSAVRPRHNPVVRPVPKKGR